MILLEPNSYILEETLFARFTAEKPGAVDITLVDFDNVVYHLQTLEGQPPTLLTLSVEMKYYNEVVNYGAEEILQREYGAYLVAPTNSQHQIALQFDLTALPDDKKALARHVSFLKRNVLASSFMRAFEYWESQQEGAGPLMATHYRDSEAIYVQAQQDRVTVIFSTLFKEEVDRVLGRVFLQEFVDARRQAAIQNAPQVVYSSREAPLEIRHLPGLRQDESVGYVSFVLFPRHFADSEAREKTISQIQLFRDYLHYHIKCAKAYMHSRMRTRVKEFLKVINRAKPDRSTATSEKRTATGRYFRPQFRQPVSPQPGEGDWPLLRALATAAAPAASCTLGRSPKQLRALPPVGYVYLGQQPYRKALEMQQRLCRLRIDEIYGSSRTAPRLLSDVLILLQHPPVFTNGRRNHGKLDSSEIARLQALDCDYVETNRGGEITFHGPGQLVAYPNLYLRDHHLATRCYVEGLENTVVGTCAHFGVAAHSIPGFPGVWTSPTEKVAALGTHVQKYVTSHGLALNCTTDMKWFGEIVPCGLDGRTATSLQAILAQRDGSNAADTSVQAVIPALLDSFRTAFACDLQPLDKLSPATLDVIQDLLK
ncbi:Arp complex subunit [Coemansia sp. RSA 552]|nr:Arp complex subunit [Coemansia sp. RSA 552]